jgi:hypothetical protein
LLAFSAPIFACRCARNYWALGDQSLIIYDGYGNDLSVCCCCYWLIGVKPEVGMLHIGPGTMHCWWVLHLAMLFMHNAFQQETFLCVCVSGHNIPALIQQ